MPDGSIGLHNHGASRSNPALAGFEIFLFEGLVKQILRVNVKDTYSGPQYNIASGGLQLAVIDDKALCRHFYAIFAVDYAGVVNNMLFQGKHLNFPVRLQ